MDEGRFIVQLANGVNDLAYAKPLYKREDVNAAGRMLAGFDGDLDGQQALEIINNWRSSHAFPLNAFHVTLRGRARSIDPAALTAQRIKRLPSIGLKLRRFPDMRLSQMQDLGGCRAVLKTMSHVDRLVAAYGKAIAKNPKSRHEFLHERDYITEPKDDGYRSFHMIYRYRTGARKHLPYNGLKIEIQIRTKLQHAWATAVEIVSTFTGQALKSNIGDDSWKRFFKLMSSDLAIREGRPLVPDTPSDPVELRKELQDLAGRLHVIDVMTGCGTVLRMMERDLSKGRSKRGHTYLMVLDSKERHTRTVAYSQESLPQAQYDYLESEKENNDKPWIQSVLVKVDSVAALRRAYPNFFLDSMAFVNAIERAIGQSDGSKQS